MKRKHYSDNARGLIISIIKSYNVLGEKDTFIARSIRHTIDDCLTEIEKDKDYGDLKKKAVMMVYINKSHSTDVAAYELNASRSTVQKWLKQFVTMVGKKTGFL